MRPCTLVFISMTMSLHLIAQNVGIGTSSPTHPLHVAANAGGFVQESSSGVKVGFYTAQNAYVQTFTNHPLHFTTNDGSSQLILATNGYFGIGDAPSFPLDVVGRMRLRQTSNTAGIWFDGTTLPTRSFLGTVNDDHVGIYGISSGWNFVMNVVNGNTGIGTTTPSQRLDVNGNLRIRGSFPKAGSVLTSSDANGNAQWMDPVAFRVVGLVNNVNASIPNNTWTKVNFNTTPTFNYGLNYQPFLSQFVCAEKGIYQFNMQMSYVDNYHIWAHRVRLILERNGSTSVIFRYEEPTIDNFDGETEEAKLNVGTGALELNPGDKIWVETYIYLIVDPANEDATSAPLKSGLTTWFSGNLLTRT